MPSSIVIPHAVAAHITNGQTYEAQQATIKTLLTLAGSNLESDADSESFALTPSTVDPSEIPASREAYLKRLSQNANAAAASLFCGSILAGHTSEADEYGDVAIALGHGTFGPGHELDVINALGLGNLAQRDQGPEVSAYADNKAGSPESCSGVNADWTLLATYSLSNYRSPHRYHRR